MMHLPILRSAVLIGFPALGAPPATGQTEFPHAAGTDSTGWAQARSNAEGRVLIESPEYPRGLWLNFEDESGQALSGLQVEYQARPDSLVELRGVDPNGLLRETLFWTRPEGSPLRLILKPRNSGHQLAGFTPIDWHIDQAAEVLLESVEATRLIGRKAVVAFLQDRWQGQPGRVAVQLDTGVSFAVEIDHPEAMKSLMAYVQQLHYPTNDPYEETTALEKKVDVEVQVIDFGGNLALMKDVILYTCFFEDSNLEMVVQKALGRPLNLITQEEVTSLSELRARRHGIHSIAGLEQFAALERLDLSSNSIVDVGPLSSLTNLNTLVLGVNQVTDVSPLASLTNLEKLNLGHNKISDVNPLSSLTYLTDLTLDFNPIADVSSLASLSNLRWLNLRWIDKIDLDPLTFLTNLEKLNLGHNHIADVSPLASLTNLTDLTIDENAITDLSSLASLTNLNHLYLHSNQISDVTPLAPLTNLEDMRLDHNQIEDVSSLTSLANLKELRLDHNQIADVDPLAFLTSLNRLNLENNRIEDVASLVANPGLGEGDEVELKKNPLSHQATTKQIPALKARGVKVTYY